MTDVTSAAEDRPLPEPAPGERWSLFLDFDGTLAEIAEHPDAVRIAPTLPATLGRLHDALGGALAVISGRPIDTIDRLLGLPRLAAAGLHGLERRGPGGQAEMLGPTPDALADACDAARRYASAHPGLLLEDKGVTIALHYRSVPELGEASEAFMRRLARTLPDYHVLAGKMVVELKPRAVDKGAAVRSFMAQPIFRGTRPIFAGDDQTDEDGFAVVQALGGIGIKVGEGPTTARCRVADVPALIAWLEELTCRLSTSE